MVEDGGWGQEEETVVLEECGLEEGGFQLKIVLDPLRLLNITEDCLKLSNINWDRPKLAQFVKD